MAKELEEALAAKKAELAAPVPEPHGFIVSVTRGGRHRKLHHLGSCWRQPGVHFRVYEAWGSIMPPEAEIQSKCLDCFGTQRVPAEPRSRTRSRRLPRPPLRVRGLLRPRKVEEHERSASASAGGPYVVLEPMYGTCGFERFLMHCLSVERVSLRF